jgi:NAD(P)-dependent dehydrogenase (short-subunit alcohol dehydrogenase family)
VRQREDWRRAMESFSEATSGKMNVLFNNAGIGRHGWFEEVSGEDNDRIIDINFKGVVYGVETALPLLKATQGARVVNTASAAALFASPQLAVYSATKFAVRGLTESLDAEFRDLGIRVTSLMPWFVQTPILEMGTAANSNIKLSDRIRANHMNVYPVEMAAAQAWEAAHGKAQHYTVGKDADQIRSLSRWMPEGLRKRIRDSVPPRL